MFCAKTQDKSPSLSVKLYKVLEDVEKAQKYPSFYLDLFQKILFSQKVFY